MAFELMELSTGNLVGVYSTQAAALRDVAEGPELARLAMQAYGLGVSPPVTA